MSYRPTAPAPAAPAPLTEDEAIDAAITLANRGVDALFGAAFPYVGRCSTPINTQITPGFWACVSSDQHDPIFEKVIGRYSPATGQYERTVPYASAKPKPAHLTGTFNPHPGNQLWPNPWQLPEQPPDTVRSPEPAPELKSCYYCQHPPGSHAPACIEVKYGHV